MWNLLNVKIASPFTQVLLPSQMPTLAEAVDLITLIMYTARVMKRLCSAVNVHTTTVRLEYTTVDQEKKLE